MVEPLSEMYFSQHVGNSLHNYNDIHLSIDPKLLMLLCCWRASETLFSHVYGNSGYYVRLFLIRMRAFVFCELNSRARKRKTV